MIVSQCLRVTRLSNCVAKKLLMQSGRNNLNKQIIRKSHGELYYRKAPAPPSKKDLIALEITGAIFWWWVLWNLFTNYHELIGISFPDPSEWTDEELGIPPEDE